MEWEQDAEHRITGYAYDSANRLIEVTRSATVDHGESKTKFGYDKLDNQIWVEDALGNRTDYRYNERSWLVEETHAALDPDDATSRPKYRYSYDAAGQLINTVDPLMRVTQYRYDNAGNQTTIIAPAPTSSSEIPVTRFLYDRANNLKRITDPLGHVTEYKYDGMHRVTKIKEGDPSQGLATTATYEYNKLGQVKFTTTRTSTSLSTIENNYYRDGKLQQVRSTPGTDDESRTYYTYNFDSDVEQIEVRNRGNDRITIDKFRYDRLGRLQEQWSGEDSTPSGASIHLQWDYNKLGQIEATIDGEGRIQRSYYDHQNRLVKVTSPYPGGGVDRATTTYKYDEVGNVLSVTNNLGQSTEYSYDNLYRVEFEIDPEGGKTDYTYDLAGRRTELIDPIGNKTSWGYDLLDRVTSDTNENGDSRFFGYDLVGNLSWKIDRDGRATTYEYDEHYRLEKEQWRTGTFDLTDNFFTSPIERTISYDYWDVGPLSVVSDPTATYRFSYNGRGQRGYERQDLAILPGQYDAVFNSKFNASGNRDWVEATLDHVEDYTNDYRYNQAGQLTEVVQRGVPANPVALKEVDFFYNQAGQFDSIVRDLVGGTELVSHYDYDNAGRLDGLSHGTSSLNERDAAIDSLLAGYDWQYDAANRLTHQDSHFDGQARYYYDARGQLQQVNVSPNAQGFNNFSPETYRYDDNGNHLGTVTDPDKQTKSDGKYNYFYDKETVVTKEETSCVRWTSPR